MGKLSERKEISRATKEMVLLASSGISLCSGMVARSSRIIIYAEPASKANSRTIGRTFAGRPILIKSAKARSFVEIAAYDAKNCHKGKPYDGRLVVEITIEYASFRPDLDEAVVLDAMQGIVYLNDRQIVSKTVSREYAKKPRVIVLVQELSRV